MNSGIIIYHHLGLGDHFVCNGIVNYFSQKQHVDLICKTQNSITIQSLYSENFNVSIIPISGINEFAETQQYAKITNQPILHIGFNRCDINNWDKSFYQQVSLDFLERYRFFKLPRKLPKQIVAPNQPFILIHNQSSDNYFQLNINSSLIPFIVDKKYSDDLLSYINLIQSAEEIHCIDSSFFHLVDSLPSTTNKLYYHDIRKSITNFNKSPKWELIKYDN